MRRLTSNASGAEEHFISGVAPPPQAQQTMEASKAPKLKSSKVPQLDFQPLSSRFA